MHAIVIREPGDADVLAWTPVPDPAPKPGEVLIEVAASAVNRADVMQRMGFYPPPPGAPPYPGLEVSGRIAELGADVTGLAVGDEVCALLSGGGYAERVTVPAGQVLPVPRGVDVVDAAGLPEVACTVFSNVVMLGGLREGETFLAHGGGSGIGTFAIQLAKARGARVVTTVGSAEKAERCRELGADVAVNYREEDFVESGPYDVILDLVGAKYLERNVEALATGGRLMVIGLQGGAKGELDLGKLLRKRALVHATTLRARPPEEKAEIVAGVREHVWPLLESGTIRPVVDRRIPIADAARAHRLLEESGHVGKILLTV
ncbi:MULTISPECIES: NAD(P)H-quinone oxidoreductase [Actinomadura]|uniref:NAD(P)H-quinone oxidoreductase n=1 Tax=Actinomadura TaxID=1988 RepID=UPI0003AD30CF|nr:NAD(P)H-quinone oxidoreductase [Actinomadura madurae]MCP9952031.1 NAD(P)H-quinone oxidoreductase [Actinomadura madurae]MCP9968790.1 NAD(P)H-quinone oxidoreductase [Actinomadura madurae]MCP9981270.1 NAD(P)H-quinone oxidoreductase [Actinomadura madurae]MCQ0007225.1 NAD(P)H-quinone oxidoreductase [Actinomadura madurae]URN08256.1 NAD(P)H-quinone oxidoreductase [Actinomadura madurae]